MTKVVVLGPNLMDQSNGSFHVHAAGCADINRNRAYRSPEFADDKRNVLDMQSVEEIAEYVYSDVTDNPTQYVSDFDVFPCVVFKKEAEMRTITFEIYNRDFFLEMKVELPVEDLQKVLTNLAAMPNVRKIELH